VRNENPRELPSSHIIRGESVKMDKQPSVSKGFQGDSKKTSPVTKTITNRIFEQSKKSCSDKEGLGVGSGEPFKISDRMVWKGCPLNKKGGGRTRKQ